MDVTSVLVAAQSPDAATRTQAEQQIESAKASNLPLLMDLLAGELGNEAKDLAVRQLSGVVLKNCLTGKSTAVQQQQAAAWTAIAKTQREVIKAKVLAALGSPQNQARHTAAQVVAAIAVIELPGGVEWPDLIAGLVKNVTDSGNHFLKQSSLEALGFVCEEIDPEVLATQSNLILTAVVQGMRKEEPEQAVRLAATRALCNALEFVKTNFENDVERNFIMQTVCETTQAENKEIMTAAYECIVTVAELYYDKLPQYMQALYQLTLAAIQKATAAEDDDEEDAVGQQAVEFWTTVCDEELDRAEEAAEAAEEGRAPEAVSQFFVKQGLGHLCPLLLEAMCKQNEDGEGEDWNMALAASCCLAKIAQCVGDEAVGHIMPFIEKHITSADWRRREAATQAFGAMLEGPSAAALAPVMSQGIDVMLKMMRDSSLSVKDTAAWTIGRVCEFHTASIQPHHWQAMMAAGGPGQQEGVLLVGLKDDPRVANNICYALHNLAEQLEAQRNAATNPLSALFVTLARALLEASERPDAGRSGNLRSSAYEALNMVITNAAEDTKPHIEQLLPVILERLKKTFELQIVSADDREAQVELQGLLCGTLQVITQKLGDAAKPFADHMMQLFLQVFAAKSSTVHEEALMAVGRVADVTEGEFIKYMEHFKPFLSLGLSNCEEHQVCAVAIGVVGDICRALEAAVEPYCDEIVRLLLVNLQNPNLNRNVKPPILSCFGDVALAVGGKFEKYMRVTMSMLVQASGTTVDPENPDLVDYLNQLREGIFEAYTGVLQGLRADGKADVFQPHMMGVLDLIRQVAESVATKTATEEVVCAAVGVVGDCGSALGLTFKNIAKQSPQHEAIKALLKEAVKSGGKSAELAAWTRSECGL